jgi:putative holliday junction resolvase
MAPSFGRERLGLAAAFGYVRSMTRLLGIDYGLERVGFALSDPLGITAQPFETLARTGDKQVCRRVAELVEAYEVGEVVVGLPLDMSGAHGEAAEQVRRFVDRLRNYVRVPVTLWDERLSSTAAERALTEQNVRGKRRRELVDQIAAALILQGVLDSRR